MTDLLLVNASPRRERSESLRLAEALLAAYTDMAPGATIDRLDLAHQPLPPFDAAGVEAKMAVIAGADPDGDAALAWARITTTFERLEAARDVVFTVPMWNAAIPWTLKHFIDTVTQPGLAFSFDPEHGYTGLLHGKRAVALYTSRVYRPGVRSSFGVDHHSRYFEYWLRYVGIQDIRTVRLQTTFPDEGLCARRSTALATARQLGHDLAIDTAARAA